VSHERIVAVGLLTQEDLEALGPTFSRVWPVDGAPCFGELLRAIDKADREIRLEEERATSSSYQKMAE
jgi:hypothetical protein